MPVVCTPSVVRPLLIVIRKSKDVLRGGALDPVSGDLCLLLGLGWVVKVLNKGLATTHTVLSLTDFPTVSSLTLLGLREETCYQD